MDSANPRILVLAASPTLRFTLEELLRYYGYDVTTAASSEAALSLGAYGPFDVTLLDETSPCLSETNCVAATAAA